MCLVELIFELLSVCLVAVLFVLLDKLLLALPGMKVVGAWSMSLT